jgi:hypothetical protein
MAAAALVLIPHPGRAQDPEPKMEVGFEQRVRTENWNNIFDWSDKADDQRNQIRYRTRLWTKIPFGSKIDFNLGLDQETNQIIVTRVPWKFDEVIFETANLEFRDLGVKGLGLKIGRQTIMKDDGFLFLEGDPWDGSRSIYFNAINLSYMRGKSKLELIGISDPARDRYLPQINDRSRQLVEWDEQAVGAYFTHAPSKKTNLSAYYFLKKEIHDTRPATNPQFQPDRHIHTGGARLSRGWGSGWNGTSEFALQWGRDHAQKDLRGWGGYGYVKKSFDNKKAKPYVMGGYWAMSDDDPSTKNRDEGFDPLFSRWPKWSELYIYSQFREKGVGYWTNLGMLQAETAFTPWKPVLWRFTYYHMDAFHTFAGSQAIFGQGTRRGEQFQTRMDFTINPSWKAHALYEYHLPGKFYRVGDAGYFVRFEVSYTFRHLFAM